MLKILLIVCFTVTYGLALYRLTIEWKWQPQDDKGDKWRIAILFFTSVASAGVSVFLAIKTVEWLLPY